MFIYLLRRYSGFQAGWATLSDNYITSDWANDRYLTMISLEFHFGT
jgi:hypothetical protein